MMSCTPSPWQSPALLPEKVLLKIFTNACIEDGWIRLSRSIRISNVCQYWKRVLLSEESLWVNFNFPHKNSNLAELALSRMNPDTLLDVGLGDVGTPELDPTGYNFLKDHWSRVWALSIYPSNPDDEYPNILQYIVDNPPTTYTLKKLDMTGDRYCESDFEDETPPPPPTE